MKKSIFIIWVALATVFAACSEDNNLVNEQSKETATIRATIDGGLSSRVALTDDVENRVMKVDWAQGDEFILKGVDIRVWFFFVYDEATGEFRFNRSDNAYLYDGGFPTEFPQTGEIKAIYPHNLNLATQTGTLEGVASCLAMEATRDVEAGQSTSNLALNFKYVSSILKMTLRNDDFKGAEVTAITLRSNGTPVFTSETTFTGSEADGSIVVYFVIPESSFDMKNTVISASCGGSDYNATLSDKALQVGKVYNVSKAMEKAAPMGNVTAAQAVTGDYAMLDGTFISGTATLTDEQKANVSGIVYWTTKDIDVTASLADDKILKADFPNCTHGLILALTDVSGNHAWQSSNDRVSLYQGSSFNAENKNDYISITAAGREGYEDEAEYILGYQNTKLLRAYNEWQKTNSKKIQPVTNLVNFEVAHPAPKNSSGWFIPSLKELQLLVKWNGEYYNPDAVNSYLEKLGTYANKLSAFYWTSWESSRSGYALWYNVNNQGQGNASKSTGNVYTVRAVCAF